MSGNKSQFPADKTEGERRRTDCDVKDLELAGGVEGGMQAGSAGGPGEKKTKSASADSARDDAAGSRH